MPADDRIILQFLIHNQSDPMLRIKEQFKRGGGAGDRLQQGTHMLRGGKGEAGAIQLGREKFGLEDLLPRKQKEIEISFLPVGKQKIFADLCSENTFDLQAVFHGIGMVVIHAGIGDVQFIKRIIDPVFLWGTFLGRTPCESFGNIHVNSLLS